MAAIEAATAAAVISPDKQVHPVRVPKVKDLINGKYSFRDLAENH